MAVQTTVEQRVAQTSQGAAPPEEVREPQSGAESPSPVQHEAPVTDLVHAGEAEAAHLMRAAEAVPPSALVLIGTATVVLVGFGLVRSRLRPALQRLAASAEEVRIPLWVPVTLVEFAWELIADRRAVSSVITRR